jgi:hypothetical protein
MLSVPNTQLVNMTPKTSTFTFFFRLLVLAKSYNGKGSLKNPAGLASFLPFFPVRVREVFSWNFWNKRHRELLLLL